MVRKILINKGRGAELIEGLDSFMAWYLAPDYYENCGWCIP